MTYATMQLGTSDWDLQLDGAGNIAVADSSYAVAQDVASACLTFYGECYYDNTLGIPWDTQVLGKPPSTVYIAQKMQAEAKKLAIVDQALCTVYFDRETRSTRGTLRITDNEGNDTQVTL